MGFIDRLRLIPTLPMPPIGEINISQQVRHPREGACGRHPANAPAIGYNPYVSNGYGPLYVNRARFNPRLTTATDNPSFINN